MTVAFWITASLLALANLVAGGAKLTQPRAKLAASGMTWAEDFSDRTVKLIGLAEVLGAVGVILPALTGIAPILTPIAAIGLVVVQIGAVITHVRRGEKNVIGMNIALILLAVAVAVLGFATIA